MIKHSLWIICFQLIITLYKFINYQLKNFIDKYVIDIKKFVGHEKKVSVVICHQKEEIIVLVEIGYAQMWDYHESKTMNKDIKY